MIQYLADSSSLFKQQLFSEGTELNQMLENEEEFSLGNCFKEYKLLHKDELRKDSMQNPES